MEMRHDGLVVNLAGELKWGTDRKYPGRLLGPDMIIIHHGACLPTATIEDVDRWHSTGDKKYWSGCGYHFWIRGEGDIWRGRPQHLQGAHCRGYNRHSLGIGFAGNFEIHEVPIAQLLAGVDLCSYLVIQNIGHGIPEMTVEKIFRHGRLVPTKCPGKLFPFGQFKLLVRQKIRFDKAKMRGDRTWMATIRKETENATEIDLQEWKI